MSKRLLVLIFIGLSIAVPLRAQRLPQTVLPDHYAVKWTPDLEKATFAGEETIRARVLEPTSAITLNSAEIQFQKVEITSGSTTQTATVSLDAKQEQATLTVGNPLPAGPVEIHISFTGILNNQLRGFYLVKSGKKRYAATQFEATDARRAFPCFDEPAMKATFDVTLVVNKGETAISNGKIISDTRGPGEDKHTLKFSTSPKMSSYLVAMAVGDFACVEGSADNVPIRVCATSDKKNLGSFALTAAEHILHYYDQYYGIKYPFEKLDVVAIPDFAAGAMENTAAIFYRESLLLIDPAHSSERVKELVASVLGHEMAHMWFGDLVTMKWWNDLWLNEGFATWMAPKALEAWKPEWDPGVDAVQETASALYTDSFAATHAVRTKADTPAAILELADEITYGKAADILRMVEAYIGEDVFQKGVNVYLKEHAYGNATAEDFWNTLARVSGKPVDKIMKSFVDQSGVPVITVNARPEKGGTIIEMSQQRFFFNTQGNQGRSKELWTVPVCLREPKTNGEGKVVCELLDRREQSFKLPGQQAWVLANADSRGYYRSAYDPLVLRAVANARKELNARERLMFLVDAWSMVRSGRLDIGDFMPVLEDYRDEQEPTVMHTAMGILIDIDNDLAHASSKDAYRAWVRKLLKPVAKKLGWKAVPGEPPGRGSVRSSVLYALGFAGRDKHVLAEARKLANQYLEDPSSVDPSIASNVIRLAGLEGDSKLYEKYKAQLKKAKTPEEYNRFLYALASFGNPDLLVRTIQFALTDDVRTQEAPFLIAAALYNPEGRPKTWDYVKDHWDEVAKRIPAFAGPSLVGSAGEVCDAASRDDVESFFAKHPLAGAERTLRETTERMNLCINLRALQESKLAAWLRGYPEMRGQ